MLDLVFLETPDYRTLIETSDRLLVVGRRGTGKSTLARELRKYWGNTEGASVVPIAPEEHQVIAVRPLVELFGAKFVRIRAGMRLIWRYALMMEVTRALSARTTFSTCPSFAELKEHIGHWGKRGASVLDRVRHLMREFVKQESSPEERIGDLPHYLQLEKVEAALSAACGKLPGAVIFLVDRLDEGYEPDDIGVGLVDGLVQAAIDLKTRIPIVRPTLFLRDNIFRAVQRFDPDYSRNIEGHVLRLHWDETSLFNFAAARLRIALRIDEESSTHVWNACTNDDLRGRDGFAKCLRLTLYRPRDLLALLNEALVHAYREARPRLALANIEATAQSISQNRLEDLKKEYSAMVPGLERYVGVFHDQNPERQAGEITASLEAVLLQGSSDPLVQQDFLILEDAKAVIRSLYSIGFLGVHDSPSARFLFCHDGRAPDREFEVGDRILVHPCYWMALNCGGAELNREQAEDIYDEYDIEVSSETPSIRNRRLLEVIGRLDSIPEGNEGQTAFEIWCHKAIRICFAKSLRNVDLKPNKLARLRRDIVGTNLGEHGAWKRIREDYQTRQVVFEVKNYRELDSSDYQQVQSYLSGEYGRIAFVVTRDDGIDLYKNRDVDWVRTLYASHKVLIIKLTGRYLVRLLHKLRNPQKHDAVDDAIHTLLDTYTRLYIDGQTSPAPADGRRLSRKKQRKLAAKQKKLSLVTDLSR